MLRRSLLKLLLLHPVDKQKKRRILHISKYLHIHIIPKAYVAFSTVVADGQFSTLGTVLLAALAQTQKIIHPLPQQKPKRSETSMLPLSPTSAKINDTNDDLGTPVRRAVEDDAVEQIPKIDEQHAEPKKVKKSKAKKKKPANAIDDIFSALR